MPTLIDELVVSLALDPKQFTDEQRKALDGLRKFQNSWEEGRKKIDQGSSSFRKFYEALENPLGTVKKGLMDLADQSVKTGTSVGKAGEAGATGMGAIARGALLAYAAVKSVQYVMNELRETAKATEQLGFASQWAGTPVEWMSRLAIATNIQTGLPTAATDSWLVNLRQAIAGYTTPESPGLGKITGMLEPLQRLGINFLRPEQYRAAGMSRDSIVESITQQVSDTLARVVGGDPRRIPNAVRVGQDLGLPPELATVLAGGWSQVQQLMNNAKLVAVTADEVDAAHKLEVAERDTQSHLEKLTRVLTEGLLPILTPLLKVFNRIIDFLTPGTDIPTNILGAPPASASRAWLHPGQGAIDLLRRYAPTWLGGGGSNPAAPSDRPNVSPAGPIESPGQDGQDRQGNLADDLDTGSKLRGSIDYFVGQGWTHNQAVGIVSRLFLESDLDPKAHNDINGGHTGIAQWDSTRWNRFLTWSHGDASYQRQLDYVQWELTNPEAIAAAKIRATSSAHDAGAAMENYERANDPEFTNNAADLAQSLSDIQTRTSGASSTSIDNSTKTGGDVHVHVTTQPGADGRRIGNDIGDAVRQRQVTNFNSGQE